MPWQLTTPIQVGDMDPDGAITHLRVEHFDQNSGSGTIQTAISYGRMPDLGSGPEFVAAKIQPVGKARAHTIAGQEYSDLVSTHTSNDGELTYQAAKRGLYEHLASEGLIDSGSIV